MLPCYCFRYGKVLLKFINSLFLDALSRFLARLMDEEIKLI